MTTTVFSGYDCHRHSGPQRGVSAIARMPSAINGESLSTINGMRFRRTSSLEVPRPSGCPTNYQGKHMVMFAITIAAPTGDR